MAGEKRAGSRKTSIVRPEEPALDVATLVQQAAHEVLIASADHAETFPTPTPSAAADTAPAAEIEDAAPMFEPAPAAETLLAEPEAIEPEIVESEAVQPEIIESEIVEPENVEPENVEPEATQPAVAFVPAPDMNEGMIQMATVYEPAAEVEAGADRLQSMFGDVNTRTKTAMEKSTKIVEEMTELTKGNVEAIVQSSRLAAKGAETIGQDAAEYGRKSFEQASGAFKSFASVKSPTELFQLQGDYVRSSFDSAVTEASKLSETYVKLMGEVFAPITGRVQLATDKFKSAATL